MALIFFDIRFVFSRRACRVVLALPVLFAAHTAMAATTAGTTTLIDLLDAEMQQIEAEQRLLIATAGLTSDYIAIQKALDLGWAPSG